MPVHRAISTRFAASRRCWRNEGVQLLKFLFLMPKGRAPEGDEDGGEGPRKRPGRFRTQDMDYVKAFAKRYERALDIAEEMVGRTSSPCARGSRFPARTGAIATSRSGAWFGDAIRGARRVPAPVAKRSGQADPARRRQHPQHAGHGQALDDEATSAG